MRERPTEEQPRPPPSLYPPPSTTGRIAPRAEGHDLPGPRSPSSAIRPPAGMCRQDIKLAGDGSAFAHLFGSVPASYTPRPVAARRASPTLTQPADEPLAAFSPAVRDWFLASFAQPTAAQVGGWAAIAAGRHTLIHAPTGSGQTLAAFLWCIDRLVRQPRPPPAAPAPPPRRTRRGPDRVGPPAQAPALRHRAHPPGAPRRDPPGSRSAGR